MFSELRDENIRVKMIKKRRTGAQRAEEVVETELMLDIK